MERSPVVGIGASAGALRALRSFFRQVPADAGLAYVVVQHLDPTHESRLDSILAKDTAMPVHQVENGVVVEPDRVYLIPPNRVMEMVGDRLHLSKPANPRGRRMPVDAFLRSLAEARGERAVALILSGTGSDGTEGVKAIKGAGGLVLVQDPEEAEYDGMPCSAITSGIVDFVAPLGDLPGILAQFVNHELAAGDTSEPHAQSHLDDVLRVVRSHTGYDFRSYKRRTLMRRVRRRLSLLHLDGLEAYLARLWSDRGEALQLASDLLINVTSFFRDPEAWQQLDAEVLSELFSAPADEPIRVWVAGCATGEEAYTLAMLLGERARQSHSGHRVQIYASDIDGESRAVAREGLYPRNIAQDVPPDLLGRYFVEEGEGYRVAKPLRDMVIFAQQDLLRDPPFSHIDLVTCRNLLIYLRPEMQRQLVETFHFALSEGGYLFLGSSESLGRSQDLFRAISTPHRIFQRRSDAERPRVIFGGHGGGIAAHDADRAAPNEKSGDDTAELDRLLLRHSTPPALLIDDRGRLLALHGDCDPYLRMPAGRPTEDAFALLRDDLKVKLRSVLRVARLEQRSARGRLLRSGVDARKRRYEITLTVHPDFDHSGDGDGQRRYLVTFHEERVPDPAENGGGGEVPKREIQLLERELETTRSDLQSTVFELQESNERHQIQNEEIMSMNEELQSANEELETSKEELQSLNEELTTLNNQLESKLEELEHTTDDLSNLLRSTNVATLFLDHEFHIRRFTPSAAELLNLRDGDVGRPLQQIASDLNDASLVDEARAMLADLNSRQREVAAYERWFLRSIQPYRSLDNRIEGVVVTFTDITDSKRTQHALDRARAEAEIQRERLHELFMQAPVYIAVHEGPEHVYTLSNELHDQVVGGRPLLGLTLREAVPELEGQNLFERYDHVYRTGETSRAEEFPATFDRGKGECETGWFTQILKPWRASDGSIKGVMSFAFEVSEMVAARRARERAQAQLHRHLLEMEAVITTMRDGLVICESDSRKLRMNPAARALYRLPADADPALDDLISHHELFDLAGQPLPLEEWPIRRALAGESFSDLELRLRFRGSGREWYASFTGALVEVGPDHTALAVVTVRDISQRIHQEQLLAERTADLARSNDSLQHFASLASHDLRAPLRMVSTYLDLLKLDAGDRLSEAARGYIEQSLQGAARMRELINGLLQYARLEGQDLSTTESVSLEETVDEALAVLEEQIAERRAVIEVAALPRVRGQRSLIAQCLQNLIANAIKYCDQARPTVSIDAEPAADGDGWVVAVRDNGLGIDPDEREAVFEMFRRGRRAADGLGSGIGLGFCRRVIEAFGGEIWIDDHAGPGTVVRFRLPAPR